MKHATEADVATTAFGMPPVWPIPAQSSPVRAGHRPVPPKPTADAVFHLAVEAFDIHSDLGMAMLHLPAGASDSALEWMLKADARILVLENALKNVARDLGLNGSIR
jgi:hypothetical protein